MKRSFLTLVCVAASLSFLTTMGPLPEEFLTSIPHPDPDRATGMIIGATIIPRSSTTWTPQKSVYRNQVNAWIRHQADFDKVYDFDKVMRDPSNAERMLPILDLGDGTHPNVYGYLQIGRSMKLSWLGLEGADD